MSEKVDTPERGGLMEPTALNVKFPLQCELLMVMSTQTPRSSGFVLDSFYYYYWGRNTQYESYPLNKSVNAQYITVSLRHVVIHQITRTDSFCKTETLCVLSSNSLCPPFYQILLFPFGVALKDNPCPLQIFKPLHFYYVDSATREMVKRKH